MLDLWKKQFTTARLSLRHEDPRVFLISQWQRKRGSSLQYLVYRIAITLFLICTWILSIVDERNLDQPYMFRVKWLIYLTNWGFTLCMVQSILCTVMLSVNLISTRKDGLADEQDNNTQVYKIYWATNIVATDAAFAITALYWTIIYDAATMPLDYLNILVHGSNSLVMFVELCVVAHPVMLGHCCLSFFFGLSYTIFSAVYYLAGGTSRNDKANIYGVIDWSRPYPTLAVCFGAMIFLVVIHCCTYVFYRFRVWLATKVFATGIHNVNDNEKAQIPIEEMFRGFDNDVLTTNGGV